ncbi:hypothetical protein C1H46_029536 [Malus baccata]|uniref:RING-CH-type domain-containing protein n=1 Tax=Malus baccata TaxID=106549 RepID=A0A540LEM1_MALBA|nr:hypothetical protein C1H46_029536 [Malus baccata]
MQLKVERFEKNRTKREAVPETTAKKLSTRRWKIDVSCQKIDFKDVSSPRGKLAECMICHDEDQDSNMETPCSCCGILRYAHKRCVQR